MCRSEGPDVLPRDPSGEGRGRKGLRPAPGPAVWGGLPLGLQCGVLGLALDLDLQCGVLGLALDLCVGVRAVILNVVQIRETRGVQVHARGLSTKKPIFPASPVGVVCLTSPVGVVGLASTVSVVGLTSPVGVVDLASPVGAHQLAG